MELSASIDTSPSTRVIQPRESALPADAWADSSASDNPAIYRQAFAQAMLAMALLDLAGRFLQVNRAMCVLLGYEEIELQGRDFLFITHPEDRESGLAALRHFQTGTCPSVRLEKRYLHKSGRAIHAVATISLVRNDAGTASYFCTHIEDLSERRRIGLLESDRRQVLEMIAQDQPLPSILHQLVRLLERQMPGMWACVMLLHDGAIRPFAPNLPRNLADAIARRPVTFAAGLASGPMGRGVLPRMADVEIDPAWEGLRPEAREAGLNCCWAVTIAGGDAVPLGILVLFSPENRPPNSIECAVLDTASRLGMIGVEHHLTTRQLAHLVRHDPLTGLPNRILFEDRLQQSLVTARRSGRPLALMALDLNRFKQVNDTLGHQAGDALLQQFSHRVRSCLRESDTLARVGGDEFMVILPDLNAREDAELVANRVREALAAAPFEIAGRSLVGSCSIGIALYSADGEDALLLQRAADAAMYRVKEQGRDARSAG